MDRMIRNYMFDELWEHGVSLAKIQKALKKQSKTNKMLAILAVVNVVWLLSADDQKLKQDRKIKALTKDVEELKRTKGE